MTKADFQKLVSEKIVMLDGATGTELIKRGMPQGVSPEQWIIDNPAAITDIHNKYFEAGADIVYVPTFGGNRFKLEEFGLESETHKINSELAGIAKRNASGKGMVFGDIGPTGKFIEPFGEVPFEQAVDVFKEQVAGLLDGGVDGFVIETMMDVQEARAALLAVRESCDLPVIVTMTFDETQRTLTGNDPVSALITFQGMGVDAFGCNCSTGPADMIKVIELIKPFATVPLLAKSNAGMPKLVGGRTVFDMTPEQFASHVPGFVAAGANILGGCCGTTPEHIKAQAAAAAEYQPEPPRLDALSAVSSPRGYCLIGNDRPFVVIGERINPTGKKALQAELRDGKLGLVKQFALEQTTNGAGILDVNMGLSGIDEKAMMLRAIGMLVQTTSLPLCIDSSDSEVVEAALRLYPGRALVNSVSAEKERLTRTLPVAAKYGAMFILLPLTDSGIPATCPERVEIVRQIFAEAEKYGYKREDIAVDGLIMTISSNQSAANVSLDLIEWCSREFGVNTVCGLSNVSFGMPERAWVNNAFLGMGIGRGLNMAIANPASELLMATVFAGDALNCRDDKLKRYMAKFGGAKAPSAAAEAKKDIAPTEKVFNCVLYGDDENIADAILAAVKSGIRPGAIVDDCLIPAINRVGELYDKKEYFLPQLIMGADAMRKGFETLEPLLAESGDGQKRKNGIIVLATVEGDIHDIGKNIVALMLRNYGFEVIDLGKDVAAEIIINQAVEHNADIVGLSALMTTTMIRMEDVVSLAREKGLHDLKFMVGGAVVDEEYAARIGASYSSDAMDAVRVARKLTGVEQ